MEALEGLQTEEDPTLIQIKYDAHVREKLTSGFSCCKILREEKRRGGITFTTFCYDEVFPGMILT